jgi:hypothetical protein
MENFSKRLLNTILNLFLDQTNGFAKAQSFASIIDCEYVQKPVDNQGLKATLFLIPKTGALPQVEVLRLEVVHAVKRSRSSSFHFTDLNFALNDEESNLDLNLEFVGKFFVSAAFLSPYLNFYNSRFADLDYLKRKYTLDYKIEYKNSIEVQKTSANSEGSNTRTFVFRRQIENSGALLNIDMVVHDNLPAILDHLHTLEKTKVKGYGSGKTVRNRFFSEDTEDLPLNDSRGFRKRRTSGVRSDFEVQHSFDRKASGATLKRPEIMRPFRLLDEVIMNDLEELSCEEEDNLPMVYPTTHRALNHVNSSSFFTETNLSIQSRKNTENKESFLDTNFADFDDSPTIDNLYYMASKLSKALRYQVKGCLVDEHSYSSKSNLQQTQGLTGGQRDSMASLSRRAFLTFQH